MAEAGEIIRKGDPAEGAERLELALTAGRENFGTLILSSDEFTADDRETANWLVGHGVIALENARLHRTVQRQALVDGLTGLANRRLYEAALAKELSRADRFGEPVTLVLADLDDFKRVNDAHGHPAGDEVLREFAKTLKGCLREIDLAARWGRRGVRGPASRDGRPGRDPSPSGCEARSPSGSSSRPPATASR